MKDMTTPTMTDNMQGFKLQSYGFSQLAQLYYPDRTPRGAATLFRKEMHETRGLWDALQETGYKEYSKVFTRSQVRVLVRFLGEP